jgi:cytochrome P450
MHHCILSSTIYIQVESHFNIDHTIKNMAALEELLSAPSALPLLFILAAAALSVLFLFSTTYRRKHIRLPPSPPKLPFIGNLHQIDGLYHRSFHALSLKHGPIMLVQLGQVPWLIVSSSDLACAILRTHDTNFASRPPAVANDVLRYQNLAFEPYNDDWKQLRKIFTVNLFSPKKLASYKAIREEEVGNLVTKISKHASSANGEPINLSEHMFNFMLDVVCRVVSGKIEVDNEKRAFLKCLIEENFNLLSWFSLGDMFPSLAWLENFVGMGKRAERNLVRWEKLLDEIFQAHMEKAGSDEGHNFVDTLLSLKDDPSSDHNLDTKNIINGLLVVSTACMCIFNCTYILYIYIDVYINSTSDSFPFTIDNSIDPYSRIHWMLGLFQHTSP